MACRLAKCVPPNLSGATSAPAGVPGGGSRRSSAALMSCLAGLPRRSIAASASPMRSGRNGAMKVERAWLMRSPLEFDRDVIGKRAGPFDGADRLDPAPHERSDEQRDLERVDDPAGARVEPAAEMQIGVGGPIRPELLRIRESGRIKHRRLGPDEDLIVRLDFAVAKPRRRHRLTKHDGIMRPAPQRFPAPAGEPSLVLDVGGDAGGELFVAADDGGDFRNRARRRVDAADEHAAKDALTSSLSRS